MALFGIALSSFTFLQHFSDPKIPLTPCSKRSPEPLPCLAESVGKPWVAGCCRASGAYLWASHWGKSCIWVSCTAARPRTSYTTSSWRTVCPYTPSKSPSWRAFRSIWHLFLLHEESTWFGFSVSLWARRGISKAFKKAVCKVHCQPADTWFSPVLNIGVKKYRRLNT